jgi:transposase-like protein
MEQINKCIGPMQNLVICNDACKEFESATTEVFPQAEKRECFRHPMDNLKKHYSSDVYGKNVACS